jgi:hypothetical protein
MRRKGQDEKEGSTWSLERSKGGTLSPERGKEEF